MKRWVLVLAIVLLFILSGCTKLVCQEPQRIDSDKNQCCDDLNKNHVCDYTEDQPLKFPGVEPAAIQQEEGTMNRHATIETEKGTITFELFEKRAPITTKNFIDLAQKGFYDGVLFHRVIRDFMIQTGDPLTKDESKKDLWGTGSPGYTIKDEFSPGLKHDKKGVVSMANAGPNTGGSQFFITESPQPHLDNKHAVFGQVTDGLDLIDQIEQGDKIIKITVGE